MPIIEIENVTKKFRATRGVRALLGRGGISDWVRTKKTDEVVALENISFSVEAGESLGLIGANGSGKSTLLKIVAGVTVPTEGSVRVYGRVASLLELGAGFHPLLSGRENVYLNAGIHGMRHAEVDAAFDRIVEFSGIGKFIDYPVATYSSGMYVRLGFAIAAHTNPDIFLIDEVLAVGDEEFQRRCRRHIGELMEAGKTILFVSHDLSIVNVLCKRVVLLNQGKMIARDTPAKAIDFYLRQIGAPTGVHTIRKGPLEAIFCNGRISLFYDQDEITTPSGFRSQIFRLGAWRGSQEAEWTISDRSETHCVARGHDAKLGLTYVWELRFEGDDLIWSTAYECTQSIEVELLETTLFFPIEYTRWVYDTESGEFYDISPEEASWNGVKAPELLCESAGLLSKDEKQHAILFSMSGYGARASGSWWNSDYLSKSRVFRIAEQLDKGERLEPGSHPGFVARFNLASAREVLIQREGAESARQTVVAGPLHARFDRGQVQLWYDGKLLTTEAHTYASLLIQNLWNDSTNLRWERLDRDGEGIRVIGASRRFPYRMHWNIRPDAPGALSLEILVEALDDLDVQEYQASIMPTEAYANWQTSTESGAFPEIRPENDDWAHLNRDYALGGFVRASGPGLPTLTFENSDAAVPVRTTVLNARYRQRARVVQMLRTAEHGSIHFSRGTHPFFSGRIILDPAQPH